MGALELSSFEVPSSRVGVLNAPSFCASHDDPSGRAFSGEACGRNSSKFTAQLLDCAVDAARAVTSPGAGLAVSPRGCRVNAGVLPCLAPRGSINSLAVPMPRPLPSALFALAFLLLAAMAQFVDPAPWKPSNATKHCLDSLVEVGVLPPNVDGEPPVWISPGTATEPAPPQGYVVSLARFHERGFGVPVGRFMRALCFHYKVELHNFSPNAISQAAVFVATESKEAVLVAQTETQRELDELVQAASAACNEIAGPGLHRLRALGGHFSSRVKEALLLGVRKALGVVTTHYQADLSKLAAGYVVADDLNDEEAEAAMDEADAAADGTARVLAGYFEGALFPGEDGGGWDDLGGGGEP
nr:unnamed protein product [Digitaria exilis]